MLPKAENQISVALCEGERMILWGFGRWRVGELGGARVRWADVGRLHGEVSDKASGSVVCGCAMLARNGVEFCV